MLLEDLKIILKVAEFRSITAAAASLDMRTGTASAAVKRVEKALGVELFIRTTRRLRLSSAGERYLPHCEQALLTLEQAKQMLKEEQDVVDGEFRIAVSSDFGRNMVVPWLDEFMEIHPKVSVRLHLSDSDNDLYRDSIDLALRYGHPDDAYLHGFKISTVPYVLCATQEYLDEFGTPEHPDDLASHLGLFYELRDVLHDVWEFSQNGSKRKVKMRSVRASNDGDLVRRWCVAGKGLAIKSSIDMAADLLAGNVVSVMRNFPPAPSELWLLCPSRQVITPAVRLLRDMFQTKCAQVLKQLMKKGILEESFSCEE